jgi:hypothetical protein
MEPCKDLEIDLRMQSEVHVLADSHSFHNDHAIIQSLSQVQAQRQRIAGFLRHALRRCIGAGPRKGVMISFSNNSAILFQDLDAPSRQPRVANLIKVPASP